jgi:hypothetical protein
MTTRTRTSLLAIFAAVLSSILALVAPSPASAANWCADSGYRTEFIYARPAGAPDYWSQSNALVAPVRNDINAKFQAAGGMEPRWRCQTQTRVVNLSASAASITSASQLASTLTAHGLNDPKRKYIVFYGAGLTGYCGFASTSPNSTTPDPALNLNNRSGLAIAMHACWGGSTPTHEYVHALGAVLAGNPHASPTGHPTDSGYDVLNSVSCASNWATCQIDVNKDTYFSLNPTPGSWLALNWNIAKSYFLYPNVAPCTRWVTEAGTTWCAD